MPRRKMTDGLDPDVAAELPELTAQQMAFVEGILAGKTATDAYRAAYSCENSGKNTVWVEASRLKSHPDVSLWIDAARAAGFGRIACTYDDHMRELERLRGLAERSGNIGAAVQAEQLRGKVAGHYVEKHEDVTKPRDRKAMLDRAAELGGTDHALMLAKRFGIEWQPPGEAANTRH